MRRGDADALILGGILAIAAAMGIGRFVYTPILPHMVDALGMTQAQAGLVASANYLGYLLGALLAAAPSGTASRRGWLLAALAASTASTALMAVDTTVGVFLTLRFLGGAASAFVFVFASAIVFDRPIGTTRKRPAAIHLTGVGIGIALSAVLVAGLAAAGGDWRALWLASGLVSLLALAGVGWAVPATPGQAALSREAETAGTASAPCRARLPVSLITAYGLFGFGYVITATFLVAIVRTTPAIAQSEPVIWILVGAAAIPSVALWSWCGRRVGTLPAFAIACLVEAAGVVSSVLWVAWTGIVLAAVLLGGTFVGITALGLMAARQQAAGHDTGRVLALMTASFGLGQMVGPSFAGALFDHLGTLVWPSLTAAGALVLAACLAVLPRPGGTLPTGADR